MTRLPTPTFNTPYPTVPAMYDGPEPLEHDFTDTDEACARCLQHFRRVRLGAHVAARQGLPPSDFNVRVIRFGPGTVARSAP
jgi:hypothetical protein